MVLRFFAFALAAAALVFGCADIERDGPYDEKGTAYNGQRGDAQGVSSSSDSYIVSSSSLQSGNVLCVIGASCVSIPAEACNSAGTQVSTCPISSSSHASSSSIANRSSSSSLATYVLTTNVTPSGAGTVTRSPSLDSYVQETWVTITASASSGYNFVKWSDFYGSTTSIQVNMDRNKTLTAVFERAVAVPCPNYNSSTHFCDTREGKVYKYVVIKDILMGLSQTWMAENLNYEVGGSVCYDNQESNCTTYGRLYDWATAMDLETDCNFNSCSSQIINWGHKGICPAGWHIPSSGEWSELINSVHIEKNCSDDCGTYLKTASGWDDYTDYDTQEVKSGNGTDDYGFSALPSGEGHSNSSGEDQFTGIGEEIVWWNTNSYETTDNCPSRAGALGMSTNFGFFAICKYWNGSPLFSVRCVKD